MVAPGLPRHGGPLGLHRLKTEPHIWILDGPDGPEGGTCLHVDDFHLAGHSSYPDGRSSELVLKKLYRWYPWGFCVFEQTGINMRQNADFSCTLTQENFVPGVTAHPTSTERRRNADAPATESASQGNPHLIAAIHEVQTEQPNPHRRHGHEGQQAPARDAVPHSLASETLRVLPSRGFHRMERRH